MIRTHTVGFLSALAVTAAAFGGNTPVQWQAENGGNGHWYMAVATGELIEWEPASKEAVALGGYLVTLTSSEENNFVFSLVDAPEYWVIAGSSDQFYVGPWTGGVQQEGAQEPDGGWGWITGELFNFAAWGPGAPNDLCCDNQNRIGYWNNQGFEPVPLWNDRFDRPGTIASSYIVEWDSQPCELVPCTDCSADLDRDSIVGVSDLILVIAQWGECPPNCPGDVDGDGVVAVGDLLEVILNWGVCP